MKISMGPSERGGFEERNGFLYLLLGLVSLSSSLLRSAPPAAGEPAPPAETLPVGGRLLR
jgi:hypothetical protein